VIREGAEADRGQPFVTNRTGFVWGQVPLDPTESYPPAQPDLPAAQQNSPKKREVARTIRPLPCESKALGRSSPRGNPSSIRSIYAAVPAEPAVAKQPACTGNNAAWGKKVAPRRHRDGAGAVCELGLSGGSPFLGIKEPAPTWGPVLVFDLSEPD
jgi:hypothetical protein